jgi:hypothetical protein
VNFLWRSLLGCVLLLANLLIFGVINHHQRLGYLLMILFFVAALTGDFISGLWRRAANRSVKPS